jgi:3-deoxy-7-phosphoheptulonate synthase
VEAAGASMLPVLLKRGLSSSLDELLMAADYVLKEGNECVMLCERGLHVTCQWCRSSSCTRTCR